MDNPINRRGFIQSVNVMVSAAIGTSVLAGSRPRQAFGGPLNPLPIGSSPLVPVPGGYVHPDRVLLWENTRKEVREALESGRLKAAILPTGSVEQHNEHMALVADVAIATLIAQQVALKLYPQVIVAPPSPCGYAPYHMARKGTVTLRKSTFEAYVFDVLSSLKAHGIHTILVLNGHGGNHGPLQEFLPGWRDKLGITLDADSYWNGIPQETRDQILDAEHPTSHAGEFETSIYLAAFPQRVRSFTMDEYDAAELDYESGFSPEIQQFLCRDGRSQPENLKGENRRDRARQKEALTATAAKGEAILSTATQSFADRLARMIAGEAP